MIGEQNTDNFIKIIIKQNLDQIKTWLMNSSKDKYEEKVKMITDFVIKDMAIEPERLLKQLKRTIDDT